MPLQLNSAEDTKNDNTTRKVCFIIKLSKSKGKYYYISNEYFYLTFLTFNIFFCKMSVNNLQKPDNQHYIILPNLYLSFTNYI